MKIRAKKRIRFNKRPEQEPRVKPFDNYAPAQAEARDHSRFILIIHPQRRDVYTFMTQFEYTYFTPQTPANSDFHLYLLKWAGMVWCVVTFPREFTDEAQSLAHRLKLRFGDGWPTDFSSKPPQAFPVNGKFVFTLENERSGMATEDELKEERDRVNDWLRARGFETV